MTPLTYTKNKNKKKKLKQVKKAWKTFKNMVKSKFQNLELATSIRDSTSRFIRFISRRLTLPFRTRYLETSSNSRKFQTQTIRSRSIDLFTMRDYHKERFNHNNYSQIQSKSSENVNESYGGRKHEEKEEEEEEEEMPEIAESMEDAWRRVVAASPHLRVNERADEFIYKFRESMRIEKERSFLEFQERLKQSC